MGDEDNGHTAENATRRFSYFCLKNKDDLCVGISTGTGDASAGQYVQLKPYGRNLYKGTEWKKMRWDVIPDPDAVNSTEVDWVGLIRLESQQAFPLCISKRGGTSTNAILADCTLNGVTRWLIDEIKGVIRMESDRTQCLSVVRCISRPDPAQSCSPFTEPQVELGEPSQGAIIHVLPCFDKGSQFEKYENAQTFWRELDCVAGCASELNYNKRCDEVCNNPACAKEKHECEDSPAPTTMPTASSTDSPTTEPPIAVIEAPFGDDLATPNYLWLLLLFLMLCCLATTAFFRRSKRKRHQRIHETESILEDKDGVSGHSHLMETSTVDRASSDDDEDSEEEKRFKTASAVALNQLRYHSRAASSSNSTSVVNGDAVKRRTDTSNNDKRYQFEEVGLV